MDVDHDALFKELLHEFLPEFMRLFFPEIAAQIDFRGTEFPQQEVFTDFPDGARRNTDVLALVRSLTGEPEALYIHIEVESQRRGTFPYRLWEYYSLLRIRRKLRIIPIVLYLSPGAGGLVMETYREDVFGQNYLSFQYHAVGLPDLNADDYRERDEPLSVTLSALMRLNAVSALERKWAAILAIARNKTINEAQKELLSTVIESYIELQGAEAAEYEKRVAATQEVEMYVGYYERRGIEKGVVQGALREKREILLRLGRKRLGEPNARIVAEIEAAEGSALDAASEGLFEAESWDELREYLADPSLARD